jgi:antitoxin FitA
MLQLVVRNVPHEVVARLERRAAEHGRSAEAEHRKILEGALFGVPGGRSFKALLAEMPDVGVDADFERRSSRRRRVSL